MKCTERMSMCLLSILLLLIMAINTEAQQSPTHVSKGSTQGKKVAIAIMPVCFSATGADHQKNTLTIGAAENLSDKLVHYDHSLEVIPKAKLVQYLKIDNIDYDDVSGTTYEDLIKAFPLHDISVFVGPRRLGKSWFCSRVVRSFDLKVKTYCTSVSDREWNPRFVYSTYRDIKPILEIINQLIEVKKNMQ